MTTKQPVHTILIVEDEDVLRNAYTSIFTVEKFKVFAAENGQVALEKIDRANPDIIILDILMPVMNGIGFLEKAQLSVNHPGTKILVLSNLSDPETITKVMQLGATQHLVKSSLSPGQLVAHVRNLLA